MCHSAIGVSEIAIKSSDEVDILCNKFDNNPYVAGFVNGKIY